MRTIEVRFRPEARRDLDRQFRYLRRNGASPATARRFVARIAARCESLAYAPEQGRLRPELLLQTRSVSFERRTVIVYIVVPDGIEIVRIVRYGQNLGELLRRVP